MMLIPVIGGPYDGESISSADVRQHLVVLTFKVASGPRRFVYLPALADWTAVLDGRMKVNESSQYHYFEMVSGPEGLVLRHDANGMGYREAISRATSEMPDRDGKGKGLH